MNRARTGAAFRGNSRASESATGARGPSRVDIAGITLVESDRFHHEPTCAEVRAQGWSGYLQFGARTRRSPGSAGPALRRSDTFIADHIADGHAVRLRSPFDTAFTFGGQVVVPVRG